MNRAFAPHVVGPEEFYDLQNVQPLVGRLVQTPRFRLACTLNIYPHETALSPVKYVDVVHNAAGVKQYFVVNDFNSRYISADFLTQTVIPTVYLGLRPSVTGPWGQVLLGGVNATDFSALGDTITVQILSGTTFQWRHNAGAWVGPLTIAGAVPLGASGLVLYFMVETGYTGFTVGASWEWWRTDTFADLFGTRAAARRPLSSAVYAGDLYVALDTGPIMRLRNDFFTQIGYTPIWGRHVAVYQNHLFVSQASGGGTLPVAFDPARTPYTVAWSDLNNPDQFFSTLINEADDYFLPATGLVDSAAYGINGMAELGGVLYIYLPDSIYRANYVGLPNVFQILPAFSGLGCTFTAGLVPTRRGHYFINNENFYFFDGVRPVAVGDPIREKFFSELSVSLTDVDLFGQYNTDTQEVIWHHRAVVGSYTTWRDVVYNERYNRWYFRYSPTSDAGLLYDYSRFIRTDSLGINPLDIGRQVYGSTGALFTDCAVGELATPLTDFQGVSTSYAPAVIETNDLFYSDIFTQKEGDALYVDAAMAGTFTSLKVEYSARQLLSSAVTYATLASPFYPTSVEGKVAFPRPSSHGRVFRLKFTFSDLMSGPNTMGRTILNAWGDFIYDKGAER